MTDERVDYGSESVLSKPFIVAIDGFGASGKTTLAEKLSEHLGGCPIIGIDYFCYPPSKNEDEWWGQNIKGYGYDWERLKEQVILPARNGKAPLKFQELDWDDFSLKWAPEITNFDALIIEGVTTLRKELLPYYDLKIWVNAPMDTQMDRVQKRDGDFMIPFWYKEFIPSAKAYFDLHRPDLTADVVVEMGEEPQKIINFIKGL